MKISIFPTSPTAGQPFAFELSDFDHYAIPKPALPVDAGRADELVLYFNGLEEMDDYYAALVATEFYREPDSMKFKKTRLILDEFCSVNLFEHLKRELPGRSYVAAGTQLNYRFSDDTIQIGGQPPLKFRLLHKPSGFFLEYGSAPVVLQVVGHLNKTFQLFTTNGDPVAIKL